MLGVFLFWDLKLTRKLQSFHAFVIGNWNIASITGTEHDPVEEFKRYFLGAVWGFID